MSSCGRVSLAEFSRELLASRIADCSAVPPPRAAENHFAEYVARGMAKAAKLASERDERREEI
jgi:hypothetical protein